MSDHRPNAKRMKTLFSFYKKNNENQSSNEIIEMPSPSSLPSPPRKDTQIPPEIEIPSSPIGHENDEIPSASCPLVRDPGLRNQIHTFPVNEQDQIRRQYILLGPFQPKLGEYPKSFDGHEWRRFQYQWFTLYPWLEYSVEKDRAFCFPCFLFESNPPKYSLFTVDGVYNWSRMRAGKKGTCIQHIGGINSTHNKNVQNWSSLIRTSQHIDRVIVKLPPEIVRQNRLRLKTTIAAVKYLGREGMAFRGHDESIDSAGRGHFIELVKSFGDMNEEIAKVVLENAPRHATYTSPLIQKEILDIIAKKIRNKIRQEIGDAKFCLLVDEALDTAHKEQMAIILRFVDQEGFVRERYFEIVRVEDTASVTLKKHICNVLSTYNLQVQNLRGQGYDGASNMRGEFHGLKALFLEDCPYGYYVHCFAHRLQLALNAAAREVQDMHLFFQMLSSIVTFVDSSAKHSSLLKSIQEAEMTENIANGDLETGTGLNQIRTLQRAGATRWRSHFASVNSLVAMYQETGKLLESMRTTKGLSSIIRGDAKGFYKAMRSFDFVFCLLLTNQVMGITDLLSQALQKKSQDIVNAINLVSSTKSLLQKLRDDGWDTFLKSVQSFGEKHGLEMPDMHAPYSIGTGRSCQQQNDITNEHYYHFDMHAPYSIGTGRSCQQQNDITNEHYYHFDMFNVIIDFQLMELNDRFTEQAMELLVLSSALDPSNEFQKFNMENICKLAEKFYPEDFTASEISALRLQLEHYKYQVVSDNEFQKLCSLAQLCRRLVETNLAELFPLVDRLIRLVLTLPVSTATTERAFSAMKIIKSRLRNKMEDGFLSSCMTVHIEREYMDDIDSETIIDDFESLGKRRSQFN